MTVALVGAGPGDPGLITRRGAELLAVAEVVVYDRLASPALLDLVPANATCIDVGKAPGHVEATQDEINALLMEHGRAGRRVVRLKGGDPFVFGRGGEELEQLRQAGVAAFVVPGITAALGCAAEAGLPLTFRKEASRLSFVTANTADDAPVDWSGLSDPHTTVVVYMGLSSAASVRAGLIDAGRDPQTPAAVLARGTRPDAKAVVGWLNELPALAAAAGEGPALLVIGDVVAHSEPWRVAKLQQIEVAA